MNNDKIFEKAKKVAIKNGKFVYDKYEFVGGCDLSGEMYKDISKRVYSDKKIKIEYFHEQFDDGSGKKEELLIFEKISPFLPKILRYSSIRNKSSQVPELSRYVLGGNWEKSLEEIAINLL
ncbi:Uncharacterised protein [uncultured archaeon]|nr:Uncharacterised protein [uncultured archaeon]